MNFFSSPSAGIDWQRLQELDNVPLEFKLEARRMCELHVDLPDNGTYPHYCVVQFQGNFPELQGFSSANDFKQTVLPRMAQANVRPFVLIKKTSPISPFLFLPVCEPPTDDDDNDSDDDSDESDDVDVESPKSPAQSRAGSASRERSASHQ